MNQSSIPAILEDLNETRQSLLNAAGKVAAGHWRTPPAPGKWSVAEVFAHLAQVEDKIVTTARGQLQNPPVALSLLQRIHVPVWAVKVRLLKRETPLALDPKSVLEKDGSVARLGETRRDLLALIEETRQRDLSAYHFRHPFLGYINIYAWFCTIANHEVRHTKQVREIAGALPQG